MTMHNGLRRRRRLGDQNIAASAGDTSLMQATVPLLRWFLDG